MAEKIQLRRSAVSGRVPTTSQLDLGEIGINTHDGKLYIKKDDGTAEIVEIGRSFNLGDLIDVDLTGLESGQVLDYDGSSWIPVTPTDVIDNTTRNINATTYKFSTNTGSSPGTEKIQLNSSDWSTATAIYINKKDKDGRDLTNFYNIVLKTGTKVFIQENKDPDKLFVAELSSDATLSNSVFTASLTNVQVIGSRPGNDKTSTFGIVYSPPQKYAPVLGLAAEDDEDLGTFTGTTISDNTTVKAALQELETALEGHIPVLVEVHNETGVDLAKGDVVYVSGTHTSGKPTVALADANGSGTYPALGLVYATVADGVDGLVIISGFLDGIDTDTPAWDAGDALYVSETAGEMTTTRPTASGTKVQKVAMTARRHASSGSVIVIGAGRTNDVPNELTALTGVALNAANLGTFTGDTITDNTTVKTALQELETAHESLPRMLHASWDASTAGSFDDANDVIASRGIASVVRSAEGIFRVTFTTSFADTNYTVTCGVGSTDYSGTGAALRAVSVLERNAAYVDVICETSDDAVNEDNAYMSLVVML